MNDGPSPPALFPPAPVRRAVGRWAKRLAVALPALAALLSVAHGADDLRFFRIGTAATSGTYFQIGGVLASAISKPPGTRECEHGGSCGVAGLVAVAQATQGSMKNLLAIGSGQMELGFAQSDLALWAYTGKGIPASPRCRSQGDGQTSPSGTQLLKDRGPMQTLRFIAALFPENVQIVVRAESPIHSLRDLKGKRVSMGEAASGTIADARLVLDAAGMSECDLKPQYLRLSRAVEALQNNEIDAFFLVAGAPVPAIAEIASLVPLRLLPLDSATLNRLMGRPPFFRAEAIPGGTYPGIDDPVNTVAVTALWVVDAAVPDDLVYAITRSLWQGLERGACSISRIPSASAFALPPRSGMRRCRSTRAPRAITRSAAWNCRPTPHADRPARAEPQAGFSITNSSTPPVSLQVTRRQPAVWQKCWKSLTAPGSVASTRRVPPGGTSLKALRAFSTGSGHLSPLVSSSTGSLIAQPKRLLAGKPRGAIRPLPARWPSQS